MYEYHNSGAMLGQIITLQRYQEKKSLLSSRAHRKKSRVLMIKSVSDDAIDTNRPLMRHTRSRNRQSAIGIRLLVAVPSRSYSEINYDFI